MSTRLYDKLTCAGFLFLLAALLLISFPRSWSLWPLGFFLGVGFVYWIKDLKSNFQHLKSNLWIVLPPIAYFTIHVLNILIQGGSVLMLVDRLMFLLVPIFGLPLFVKLTGKDDVLIFRTFIAGIVLVMIILIVRIVIFVYNLVPEGSTFLKYSLSNNNWFFTSNISVFEHPSYYSMKIMWVLMIFILFHNELNISARTAVMLSVILSVFVFLLASRASIIFWILTVIFFLIRLWRKKVLNPILLILIILPILILAGIAANKITRVNELVNNLNDKIQKENFEWRNIDQRTREWYTAIEIIKEKPLTGIGYVKIKDKLREEYLKNGFDKEAVMPMNAHNQFLEAQMTFGIAGTLSLLWMLLTPLFFRKQLKYPHLAVAFVLLISFFLMFESMFNRQWGIMFFILFYFILSTGTMRKGDDVNNVR